MEISFEVVLFLILAATFAGLVDSLAGGGGLIQLPALLVSLPDTSPSVILGTNKVPSFLGTLGATASYLRKIKPDFKLAAVMGLPAFIGSAMGASVATKIPRDAFRPIILFLLIIVAIYTWFKPDLGKYENLRHLPKQRVQIAAIAGAVIGFYDGIFGPGTGSFLMLILVVSLGYAFITASAIAKVVNVATNVGAIMIFGLNGAVIWQIGIIMGVANISGAILGSRLAIKGGSTLVRKVFLIVTVALIFKVGIDTF